MNDPFLCHGCKLPITDLMAPALWFPEPRVHEMSQSLVIMTHQFCCGALNHTEPVAVVSSYLRPVKENARLMCGLMNQYLLAGRPQPDWIVRARARWEGEFKLPS